MNFEAIILGGLVTIAWGLLFYLIKQQAKRMDKLENDTNSQELKIRTLEARQLAKEELEVIVKNAVCNAMNEFKLELFEEGILKPRREK